MLNLNASAIGALLFGLGLTPLRADEDDGQHDDSGSGNGNGTRNQGRSAPTPRPATSALTDSPPVIPTMRKGLDLGPACQQCGGMMQRTGSCYTCSSCGFNTGCG